MFPIVTIVVSLVDSFNIEKCLSRRLSFIVKFLDIFFKCIYLYFRRHVVLPKQLSKLVPTSHLMTEEEWRGLGVQQSQGWIHYMIHKPGQ